MPTYTYRCLHCQALQSVFHGMQEVVSPACALCGGLTQRIVGQAPVVLSSKPVLPAEAAPENATNTTHTCHSACVLHRTPLSPVRKQSLDDHS
jgi:putative FmdB family regulatory protein